MLTGRPGGKGQSPVVPRGFEKRQEVDPAWLPAHLASRRRARSVRLKSRFQTQRLAEPACYLVHHCLRYIAGGIAAEQSEHARTAQVSLKAGLAGDDVEVDVLKAFRFGEQRHVGLAAADHIPQRGADGSE